MSHKFDSSLQFDCPKTLKGQKKLSYYPTITIIKLLPNHHYYQVITLPSLLSSYYPTITIIKVITLPSLLSSYYPTITIIKVITLPSLLSSYYPTITIIKLLPNPHYYQAIFLKSIFPGKFFNFDCP